jgi:hypothetical protein
MKKLSLLAVLFAFGCGSAEPEPEEGPAAGPAPAPEARGGDVRGQIAIKNAELRQADIDLGKIMAERMELDTRPASEAKTNRLAELGRIEADTKQKKQALEAEIAALERRAQDSGAPAAKARSADEALDLALAAEDTKQKEEEEKRRAKAAADAGADKKRLEEAEKARAAEAAARDKEKIQAGLGGTAPAAGADGPIFEERWAAAILKVRTELQRYKRW